MTKDPETISKWENRCKVGFNIDSTKLTQEVVFCRKTTKACHPPLLLKTFRFNKVQSRSISVYYLIHVRLSMTILNK